MKTTRLMVTQKKPEALTSDLLVYCLAEDKKKAPQSPSYIKDIVSNAFKLGDFSGKSGEQLLSYPALGTSKPAHFPKRILIIGVGDLSKGISDSERFEILREIGGSIIGVCEKIKAQILTICLPQMEPISPQQTAQCLSEGLLLGDYRFLKYKETKKKKDDYTGLKTIQVACTSSAAPVRKGIKLATSAANAACKARDMANEPGNGWTSKEFAGYAKQLSADFNLKYTCIEKKQMVKLGMGGILAVNQGSAIAPRLVILEYNCSKSADTILLVGKGVTFDSGGISIKPSLGMEEMKYDMCGGAAVLTAMQVVGQEKPKVNVVAIVPATDNMSGSHAVRPGDIIKHFNKVTAEIVNTDAEGRMILGDALSYGIKTFKPTAVIDIATLTGAVIVGLGHHHTGLMGNHDVLAKQVITAGKTAGEPIWQLPLTKEYKKQIKSDVADIKNIGGSPGGSITAAAYLSNFVGDTPWCHLDIAGTAWNYTKKSYIPKGPSGIGTRTFVTLIRNWKKGLLK